MTVYLSNDMTGQILIFNKILKVGIVLHTKFLQTLSNNSFISRNGLCDGIPNKSQQGRKYGGAPSEHTPSVLQIEGGSSVVIPLLGILPHTLRIRKSMLVRYFITL